MLEKIAKGLTRRPGIVIAIAIVLLVPSLFGVITTRVNYDILSYLPKNLDSTKGQDILEKTFHNAATSMLIIEDMPGKDEEKILNKIKDVHGVSDVYWISDILDLTFPPEMLPEDIHDIFYSGNATMMIVQYENTTSSEETMQAISDIRKIMNKQCFLSGFSVIVKDTKDLADHEMPIYVILAVILSLFAMLLTMESWVLPFVFMLGIFFAVAYNFGSNLIFGQISYVTKSIAAILQLGVTMDYSIFLVNRYDEEKQNFADRKDAMAQAIQSAFVSLSGSSLTTIAGFGALCFMRLSLGMDIGLVMMKGVVLGVATAILLLPSFILQFDKVIHKYTHKTLVPNFAPQTNFIIKHHRVFVGLFLLMFLPAIYAQSNVSMYYNLDASLPKTLPSIMATNKLKDKFNMASTHFVIVNDKTKPYKMKEMVSKIEKLDGIESVLAYDKFIGPVIPDSFVPQEIKDICKKDGKQVIMVNSSFKAASDEANNQIDQMNAIVKKYDPTALITGEAPLTKDLIEIANHDFKVTNIISVISIFIIVAICFQSVTIPIILVAVIELAIFINQGIPFFTGTVIPFISPTVIGCIQLGATVDYAILMATRFREEVQKGNDRLEAIRIAANTSDRSIMTSALVFFCATLGVSLISRIEMIQSICAMLARGALISAVVIVFILSPILYMTEGFIEKTTLHWRTPKVKKTKKLHAMKEEN